MYRKEKRRSELIRRRVRGTINFNMNRKFLVKFATKEVIQKRYLSWTDFKSIDGSIYWVPVYELKRHGTNVVDALPLVSHMEYLNNHVSHVIIPFVNRVTDPLTFTIYKRVYLHS